MTFVEPAFWYLTLAVFLIWLRFRTDYRATLCLLLTGSLVFYGFHQWQLLFLLLTYCVVNWFVALRVELSTRPKRILGLGIVFNLAILGYFKYTPLALNTLGLPAPTQWTIPFGISFYAFTGIAYMVDVYRRIVPAERDLLRYTLSAMFFPHLVAGPILRPDEFLTRLKPESMPRQTEAPLDAVLLIAMGAFKKMVLADRIAVAIDPFFVHVADSTTSGVWALPYVYLYALQIYFDFSGYTDIALGLGLMFGFRWPQNFDRPYLATSIQDFWRRWHMTLSRFLRDYLYIPLGGSKHGPIRTCVNLMLTMLLGGLWHGAAWSFLIWGGLHGLFLIVNRLWAGSRAGQGLRESGGLCRWCWSLLSWALTFHCVCAAWCFFRLTDWTHSITCLEKCLRFESGRMFVGEAADFSIWLLLGLYLALSNLVNVMKNSLETKGTHTEVRGFLWGTSTGLILLALVLSPGGQVPPFIYFQF